MTDRQARLLASTEFAVIDVETTGLNPRVDRIVEIAVLTTDAAGVVRDRYETLIQPGPDVRMRADRIEMVADAPAFAEIAGDIIRRLDGRCVAGHNVVFDLRFLDAELRRLGHRLPNVEYVCTRDLATLLGADVPNRTLAALSAYCGVTFDRWHTAGDDAAGTAAVMAVLLERAASYGRNELDVVAGWWDGDGEDWPVLPGSGRVLVRDPTRWPPSGDQPGSRRATEPSFRRLGDGGSRNFGSGLTVTIEVPNVRLLAVRATARQTSDEEMADWDPHLQDLVRAAHEDGPTGDAAALEILELVGTESADDDAPPSIDDLWWENDFRGLAGIETLEQIIPVFRDRDEENLTEALLRYADLLHRHGGRHAEVQAAYDEAFAVAAARNPDWLERIRDEWWAYLAARRDTDELVTLMLRCLDDPAWPAQAGDPIDTVTWQMLHSKGMEPLVAERLGQAASAALAARGNQEGAWEITGVLARVLEQLDRPDDAAALCESAWQAGCGTAWVCDRLSLRLERAKEFVRAVEVCERALATVQRPQHKELVDRLAKRRDRCLAKPPPTSTAPQSAARRTQAQRRPARTTPKAAATDTVPLPSSDGAMRVVFVDASVHYVDARGEHSGVLSERVDSEEARSRLATICNDERWLRFALELGDQFLELARRRGDTGAWGCTSGYYSGGARPAPNLMRRVIKAVTGHVPPKPAWGPLVRPAEGRWSMRQVFGYHRGPDAPTVAIWHLGFSENPQFFPRWCDAITAGDTPPILILPASPITLGLVQKWRGGDRVQRQGWRPDNVRHFYGSAAYVRPRLGDVVDIDGTEILGDRLTSALAFLQARHQLRISAFDVLRDPVLSAQLDGAAGIVDEPWTPRETKKLEALRKTYDHPQRVHTWLTKLRETPPVDVFSTGESYEATINGCLREAERAVESGRLANVLISSFTGWAPSALARGERPEVPAVSGSHGRLIAWYRTAFEMAAGFGVVDDAWFEKRATWHANAYRTFPGELTDYYEQIRTVENVIAATSKRDQLLVDVKFSDWYRQAFALADELGLTGAGTVTGPVSP